MYTGRKQQNNKQKTTKKLQKKNRYNVIYTGGKQQHNKQ